MDRRGYLKAAGGIVATTVLTGCTGNGSGGNTGTGYLTTEVRAGTGDIQDFKTLVLLITKKYLQPSNGERQEINIHDTEVNLTQLQGDWAKPIGSTQDRGQGGIREPLNVGEYNTLQLEVEEVVEATLNEGNEPTVTVPEEGLLSFNTNFEIRREKYATFVAVIAPVEQDEADQYVLEPMTDEVEVSYRG